MTGPSLLPRWATWVAALARARAALVAAIAVTLLVAACGSPSPTQAPAGSPASTAQNGPTGQPTARPRPTATALPTASPAIASPAIAGPAIVGATQVACPGSAPSAHRGRLVTGQSRNWAGYIVGVTKGHVTCVEGTWTQPAVRCSASDASVAIWVGIDGSSAVGGLPDASATLAQTGTSGDCVNGRPQYAAWYEFLPDLRHIVQFHLPVAAGDRIWAQVRWLGKGKFMATLINLTQRVGTSQAWTLRGAPLLTAEWVVEDPAASCSGGSSCTFIALARFAPVTLTGAVTISGSRYALGTAPFPYLRTTMYRSGHVLAQPSALTSRGFSVAWKAT